MKIAQRPFSDIWAQWKPKLNKFVFLGIALIILVLFGTGSWYQIQEQEQAVLITLGVPKTVAQSGLHFKIPLIQRVVKVDTTIKRFAIGYDERTNGSKEDEALMITKDYNFVNVDFFVEYRVSDPVKALFASYEPVLILKNIAQGCIRTTIGGNDVDSVLTTGKGPIQAAIRTAIIKKLEEFDIGLQLINITIQDAAPPTLQVMEAFKQVETAKQSKETAIHNANKYRNARLPEAEAEIDKILQEAESTKARRVNEATAQVATFNAMYEEYAKNPRMTKERMYYETMEEVLPNLKVIIDGAGRTNTMLPLDSFFRQGGGDE
ncbi:MAG: FtsH protease activity modulator HflK [Fusobacteriaceae bacterium]|jgi:membrane protease subunit HflK|nr:FtsH protease activity modulator HflK [Fusobacteriaceae bacterium]